MSKVELRTPLGVALLMTNATFDLSKPFRSPHRFPVGLRGSANFIYISLFSTANRQSMYPKVLAHCGGRQNRKA